MKVTYRWLEEFVDIPWDPFELAEKLTLTGSEVESVDPVKSIFEKVVVGYVTSCKQHPQAKHLKICRLDIGKKDRITVVCGAPNVAADQNVVVALPGSKLPDGKAINLAKIRGVDSSGMICSEKELGFSDVADEIMELPKHKKPGQAFDPGKFSEDHVLDIFINPNRPDCMSIYGIAREISALSGKELRNRPIKLPTAKPLVNGDVKITIKDANMCPRYTGAVISGVDVRPAPYEIQQRLNAVGIRPINNIVDSTNYCLIEWGHPIHAFDLNLIEDRQIVIKSSKKGQKFVTLDNVTRQLNQDTILISDREKPVALGGIMGGANSEIHIDTTNIFIESAYFQPQNILRNSKNLNLHTEASHRFSRGMDPNYCLDALKRTCELILKCSPGQLHKPFFDEYPEKIKRNRIFLRSERVNDVLGTDFEANEMENALKGLEIDVKKTKNGFNTTIPTFRPDLYREIDLIEEVARVIGLENIQPKLNSSIPLRNITNVRERNIAKLRTYMTEFGFIEVFTYSMIDKKHQDTLSFFGDAIFLTNPISPELSMMRQSLAPGLLNVALHNFNRGVENLRIFELGKVFTRDKSKKDAIVEKLTLGGAIFGQRVPPSWDHLDTPSDFFTIKGILESLFRKILLDKVELISYAIPYLEECSAVMFDGQNIGYFGRYRNDSLKYDFAEPIFMFEIDINPLILHLERKRYFEPYSKFPPAKRDLAFVIPDSMPVKDVYAFILENGKPLLKNLQIDDIYRGKQIEFDHRSVMFSMKFFADDRNLQDEEVDQLILDIIDAAKKKFGIDIRR